MNLRTAAIPVSVLLLTACTRDASRPPRRSGDDPQLQAQLRPTYRVRRPPAGGSRAVVLVVPGCSGFGPKHYEVEATRLMEAGFIVANVDYLAARGLTTACPAPGDTVFPVSAATIAEYVLAAANDVRSDTSIRATRVIAIGGSLGGGAVLAALGANQIDSFPIDRVAVLYPQCRGVSSWSRSIPALILLGGLDNIAAPAVCRSLLREHDSTSLTIVHTYQRAHHAFDADELNIVTEARTEPTAAFNPEAAADAWRRIVDFISKGT